MTRDLTLLTDEDCLLRSLDGDPAPFEQLVHRYQERLFRYIYRIVGNEAEAEDIFQKTFLRAFRKRETFRRESRFSTWIYTIATNCCRDEIRRRSTRRTESQEDLPLEIAERDSEAMRVPGPDRKAYSREVARHVHDAMDRLPESQRSMLVMSHFEGMDYKSIAEVLGCSVGTVKSGIHRAKQSLRKSLVGISAEDVHLPVCEEELHELP